MKSITSILTVLALGTTLAIAADEKPAAPAAPKTDATKGAEKPKVDHAEVFKKLDTNGDGKITLEEWNASPKAKKDPAKGEASFARKDKNGDKSLSLEEIAGAGKK